MSNGSISAALRNAVWINYIGNEKGTSICYCCELQPIDRGNYECGHVISKNEGGPTVLDNLRPICGLCNKSMGTKNMNNFKKICGFGQNTKADLKCELCQQIISQDTLNFINKCINCEISIVENVITQKQEELNDIQTKMKELLEKEKKINEEITTNQNYKSKLKKIKSEGENVPISLDLLTVPKLRQLCDYFEITGCSNKRKAILIEKLKNVASIEKIQQVIDEARGKKFFCTIEHEIIDLCTKNIEMEYIHHFLYTDHKISGDTCHCGRLICKIYYTDNAFYKSEL